MPKVGVVSLGCPKNLVDSEVMMGLLVKEGYELTPHPEEAQILLVNTCSFIEPAQKESIDTILELAEYKKSGVAEKLVVTGCLVERFRQQILSEIPEVDAVLGTNEVEKIVEACSGKEKRNGTGENVPYLYHEFTPRVLATPSYSAYIKIAEGCDHPCSFCVIPQMRGHFRSRRFASLIAEVENLAQKGVREITLIGQDTTSYGEDLGIRGGLATLLSQLARIPELAWVRFLYCYPNRLTEALMEAVAGQEKICKYLDIPLQHSSGQVLKRMKRGSNGDQFLKMLEKARRTIPGLTLRTSMIVGFPGETDEDFEILYRFVEAAEFDHLGVFLYSNEETSGSFHLPDPVPAPRAEARRRRLMKLQQKISRRKLSRFVGKKFPLLVEGVSSETELLLEGRLESQAPEIDGKVLVNDFEGDEPRPGQCRWVRIEESSNYDLVGKLLAERWARDFEPVEAPPSSQPGLVQIRATGSVPVSHAVSHL